MDELDFLMRLYAEKEAKEIHANLDGMEGIYLYHHQAFWEWLWKKYLSEQERDGSLQLGNEGPKQKRPPKGP